MVNYNGASKGKLRARVISPSGTEEEALIQEIDDGKNLLFTYFYASPKIGQLHVDQLNFIERKNQKKNSWLVYLNL